MIETTLAITALIQIVAAQFLARLEPLLITTLKLAVPQLPTSALRHALQPFPLFPLQIKPILQALVAIVIAHPKCLPTLSYQQLLVKPSTNAMI